MVNVSNIGNRRTAQERITNNRDGILPSRRLVDAPELRNREDMRNAFRADGEVDEVRRTLGLVGDAAMGIADVGTQRHAIQSEKDAGQGRADEAMGQVDEAKAAKSTAYRTAIAMSRARKKVAEIELVLRPEVEDLLARGADADPTKGEQPVDLEDVNELIESRFRSLVLDEEGKPIDFGDSTANLEVYGALEQMRPKLLQGAQEIIRQQEAEKVIRGFGDELELEIMRDGTADIETYMARLPPGVDRNAARTALMSALINGAEQAEDPDIILKAADSRRADGTPTWTPQQEGKLRDEARRLREVIDRDAEKEALERSHATLGDLSVRVRQGHRITPAEVETLIAARAIRPQDAELVFALQDRVESDARQRLEWARSDVRWAQSQQERAESRRAQAGLANSQNLRAEMAAGNLTPGRALREATRLYTNGDVDLKTYEFLADEARKIPTDSKAVANAEAAVYEERLNSVIRTAGRLVTDGKPGLASQAEFNLNTANARHAFYQALRQGYAPGEALAKALAQYPAMRRESIAGEVNKALGAASRAPASEQKK